MSFVTLSSVATIDSGSGFPLIHQGKEGKQFPFLKVSDMNIAGNSRYIHKWNNSIDDETRLLLGAKVFMPNSIIFPKVGAAIATNKKRQIAIPSCVDNNVMGIAPNTELILSDYLYYLLLNKNLSEFASSANPPSIRKSDVENWKIYVPSIKEQTEIVSILSKAEEILFLRSEISNKTTEFLNSLFYKSFGDLSKNSKEFDMVDLASLCDTATRRDPRLEGDKVFTYIDIGAIDNRSGKIINEKYIKGTDAPSRARQVIFSGDVIISTVRPNLKGIALVDDLFDNQICSTGFCVLRPKDGVSGEFIFSLVRSNWFIDELMKKARGAQYPAVSDIDILSIKVINPSSDLQKQYANQIHQIGAIQAVQNNALVASQKSYSSLFSRFLKAN
jgi:restriction endonuclease S subunit